MLIEPLLAAIRQDRYVYIKDLHIWDYPMSIENAATLVTMDIKHNSKKNHNYLGNKQSKKISDDTAIF